mmetsp:Transcript_30601/g.30071  ORF Transcript_30601/g.30071 Transcript_30601/m.30071 type:complete len:124 (+) Transcript_30601:401-772(+)
MSYLEKLVIYFDDIFWPEDADGFIYAGEDLTGRWMFTMPMNKWTDEPMLVMFNMAGAAVDIGELSDEDLLAEAIEVLGIMFEEENVANVLSYVRTDWSHDPYALMSYAGMGLDSKYPKVCKDI